MFESVEEYLESDKEEWDFLQKEYPDKLSTIRAPMESCQK